MTRTRTTRYVTLLSFILALALTAALAACGSDEPSGVTGPDRTASIPTETPASPARTPTTPGSEEAPTATVAAATAALAASGGTVPDRTASIPTETPASPARTPTTPGSEAAPTATVAPEPAAATAPPAPSGSVKTDREALVALYNATDGENWIKSANWLSDAPLDEWYGIQTIADGRVGALYLSSNDLSGQIPAELGSLSFLLELELDGNDLSGEIPGELGNLSNLSYMFLQNSDLSGCVPMSLEDQPQPGNFEGFSFC